MGKPKETEITVKAVVRYARELNDRASRARVKDPYADPFTISEAAARKVWAAHGQAALTIIAGRAVEHERGRRDAEDRAARAHSELLAHQLVEKGTREAIQASMTLGARLDAAFTALSLLSETPAARLDGDRVTGSKERGVVFTGRRRLDRDRLFEDAEALVRRAEHLFESSRRRMIESEAA